MRSPSGGIREHKIKQKNSNILLTLEICLLLKHSIQIAFRITLIERNEFTTKKRLNKTFFADYSQLILFRLLIFPFHFCFGLTLCYDDAD